jgi:serine/threonine-protein kinase RsbW
LKAIAAARKSICLAPRINQLGTREKMMGHTHASHDGSAIAKTGPVLETTTRILDSTKESVDCAESAVLETARRSGFQEAALERICLAVHEIMTNAVVHGNWGDVHKKVVVTISRTLDKLKIAISDEGDGFDPDRLPDPLSAQGLLKGSGRGVYLARTFMDEFSVEHDCAGRTTVTMVKYLG